MLSRDARRWAVPLTALLFAGVGPAGAQNEPNSPKPAAAPAVSADEAAIRALDDQFVRDYDRADGKALAALFTDDAEVTEADGTRYQGRDLVEKGFADTFAAARGATITLEVESIRFVSRDVAREEGRSVVRPKAGSPVASYYTVLYVKKDGRWRISSVREEDDPAVRPHDRLKDLEWMLGDWVDEGPDSVVKVNCRWSEDENFLIRTFAVTKRGKPAMTVTQRVGWDPLARQFRSWEFDSAGGYGEGKWGRDGDRWVVKQSGVRPEGTTASATNILTRERPDLVRWRSVDRVVGETPVPDDPGYVLVRVPPKPGLGPKRPPTTLPNPAERSAR